MWLFEADLCIFQGYLHTLAQPNTMLRIYPTGYVLYSIRYSLDLSCNMDLKMYPFDVQTCHISIGSCE